MYGRIVNAVVGLLYMPDDIMVHEIINERIGFQVQLKPLHIALLKGGRPDEGIKRVSPTTVCLPFRPSLFVHSSACISLRCMQTFFVASDH